MKFTMNCMAKVNIPDFFAFVNELITTYEEDMTLEDLNIFLGSMVARLKTEGEDVIQGGFKTNMAIQKIWDLVNVFTGLSILNAKPEGLALFERTMQPAFEFLQQADKIEFDDSILKTMAFFINREEQISETM